MIGTKALLLLFGALLLVSYATGEDGQLDPKERYKIIKRMLKSQKDIHRALLRIRQQIINDGQVPEGEQDNEDEKYDESSEESEESYRERQREIREARERINEHVREIAENFEEIHELIAKIERKVDEEIVNMGKRDVSFNLHYRPGRRPKPKPSSEESTEMPTGGPDPPMSTTEVPPTEPPMPEQNNGRRRKRPFRNNYRASRAWEALGAAEEVVQ
ncbi:uncharacterized protein LOC120426926 [Culex pipiens pallens]|uniref:uncharacterized protein LOC120426926 n=1 Tax=Culex pipiens pallens TaxID=42434 RepID=UPI001953B5CB|nr:uncharacterized protein LOC120426926 [Culex pipiens pallens]